MTIFYTRKGDGGKSKIGSKSLLKDAALFQLLGGLDELNSWLGLCKIKAEENKITREIIAILASIQQDLFVIQAEVAVIGGGFRSRVKIGAERMRSVEKTIGSINSRLPAITKFIIPGGSELSARIDVARAIARRVERIAVTFSRKNKLRSELLRYLNRLSSLLFVLARLVNYKLKIQEENPKY